MENMPRVVPLALDLDDGVLWSRIEIGIIVYQPTPIDFRWHRRRCWHRGLSRDDAICLTLPEPTDGVGRSLEVVWQNGLIWRRTRHARVGYPEGRGQPCGISGHLAGLSAWLQN